jgi:aldehyde dehydrogenase (NAD+)
MVTINLSALSTELLLIGNERREGAGDLVTRYYAGTGAALRDVRMAAPSDLDAAVECARAALPQWRALAPSVRRDIMLKAASILISRAGRLAELAAVDSGLPVQTVGWFIKHAAEWLTYYAGWVDKAAGGIVPTDPGAFDYVRHEPYGVIGVISPSNSSISAMILAPLLAAGNCAVFKPSEFTSSLTAEYLQVFLDAGIPPGVVNCVPGGADIGEALVRHAGIDKIHFTGSCAVGAKVSALAASLLKPAALELGGKSANIVFADADVDTAASIAMRALVRQSGQSCVAGTRVLVHESIADAVLLRTIELTRSQKVGDPLSPDTAVGPVVSAAACQRIMGIIEQARDHQYGCVVLGGDRLGGALSGGYFISPTIFTDVDNANPLAQEETFGPVISFITFRSDEDAILLANASNFGLAAYIQTADLRRAHRISAQLDVGTIWINGAVGIIPGGPFGGVKASGYGRVGGLEGMREFSRPKNVWIGL